MHPITARLDIMLASGTGTQQPAPTFSSIIFEDPAYTFGHGDPEARAAAYTKDFGRPVDQLRTDIMTSSPGRTEADIEGKIEALQQVTHEAVVSVFSEAGQTGELLPLLSRMAAPTLLLRADPAMGTTLDDAAGSRYNLLCRRTVSPCRSMDPSITFTAAGSKPSCR
jgi:hypothetical protein